MFTAEKARELSVDSLDARIEKEVKLAISLGQTDAYIRVYVEDSFFNSIEEELKKRGFHSIKVPNITLKGDVYFSWKNEDI